MKKGIFLIMVSILVVLTACNKEETTTENTENIKQTEETTSESKDKDNELTVVIDGEETKMEVNKLTEGISFAKEIKIQKGAEFRINPEDGAIVTSVSGNKVSLKEREVLEDSTSENQIEMHKSRLYYSDPEREEVPVIEFDLNKYPSIQKDFDYMIMADKPDVKNFVLLKVYEKNNGSKILREAKFDLETKDYNENTLNRIIAVLSSIKY